MGTPAGLSRVWLWTAAAVLGWVPAARAQPADVVPSSGVDRASIRLSESTRLTLALEGPAPLRVDLPAEPDKLLTPESAASWRIRPAGDVTVTPLPEGRDRWERPFRLDPWVPGEKTAIRFTPVKVTAGTDLTAREVTWPAVEVRVQATVAEAKAEKARPVTGIEELPPLPPPDPAAVGWQVVAALAGVFAAVVIGALIRRARATPPPPPPGAWAVRELDRLGDADGATAADRVAAVLREFVERRYGLPAPKLTTAELLAACARAGWPAVRAAALGPLLERCDRAKFAGDVPDAAGAAELVTLAREWVAISARVEPDRTPESQHPNR